MFNSCLTVESTNNKIWIEMFLGIFPSFRRSSGMIADDAADRSEN